MTGNAALDLSVLETRVEKLTHALLHIAGELWVVRDRQVVLEQVLADGGVFASDRIDAYLPDAMLAGTLAAERDAFVATILDYLAPTA